MWLVNAAFNHQQAYVSQVSRAEELTYAMARLMLARRERGESNLIISRIRNNHRQSTSSLTTPVGSRCVGTVISGWRLATVCACLSVYPRSKRKMVRASNAKLGKHTVHGSRSACIDHEVKRFKG